mgnify:FL=1
MLDKLQVITKQNGVYTHAIEYINSEDCPVSFQVVAKDELDAFKQWTDYMLEEASYAISQASRD